METRKPILTRLNIYLALSMVVLTLLLSLQPVCAEDENATSLGYRIAPLQEKLAALTDQDIKKAYSKYPDMTKHWSRIYVGKLTSLEILSGMPDGTFKPDKPLQIDQFIKMAVSAMGYKPGQNKKYQAQPYIDIAIKEGIVLKGEFASYTKPITREQMARIIIRVTLLLDTNPGSKYDQYIIGKLKDYASIADNMKQSVIDAYKLGMLSYSTDGKFRPKANLTRAEGCVVILRLLDKKERKPLAPGPDEIIKYKDPQGNWHEIYPGTVREYFDVAKSMYDNIHAATGYVVYGENESGGIYAGLFEDETKYKDSYTNLIGSFNITPETSENSNNPNATVYQLTVYNDELYKKFFVEYSHGILKTIFGKDAEKAIKLHDKYMNMKNNTLNRIWEEAKLNNRKVAVLRDSSGFSFKVSILGKK